MNRRRKPIALVAAVPELKPCPVCLVRLEAGSGPNGLAHHGCSMPSTPEALTAFMMRQAAEQLARGDMTLLDGAKLLKTLFPPVPNPVGRPKKDRDPPPLEEADRIRALVGAKPTAVGG